MTRNLVARGLKNYICGVSGGFEQISLGGGGVDFVVNDLFY